MPWWHTGIGSSSDPHAGNDALFTQNGGCSTSNTLLVDSPAAAEPGSARRGGGLGAGGLAAGGGVSRLGASGLDGLDASGLDASGLDASGLDASGLDDARSAGVGEVAAGAALAADIGGGTCASLDDGAADAGGAARSGSTTGSGTSGSSEDCTGAMTIGENAACCRLDASGLATLPATTSASAPPSSNQTASRGSVLVRVGRAGAASHGGS